MYLLIIMEDEIKSEQTSRIVTNLDRKIQTRLPVIIKQRLDKQR